ncbi:MAG: ABC transporter ATP-binding protein [Lachnospiraceae bacterium]|nr:ABC transporter ATP-binding protein [Lachnospiraceae bacterium]
MENKKDLVLSVENISKKMGKKQILSDVSFETHKGEIFGFLGPNGAGKTTTIKLIAGLLYLDSGKITISGYNIENQREEALKRIGVIVENPIMYEYMSGMDNLKQFARARNCYNKKTMDEIVELVGLSNRINDKVGNYSLGMKQRIGLGQALIHDPELIILDEPTNGLDPIGIKSLRDLLVKIAKEKNISILVSSHIISEMQLMCDVAGIIVNGKIADIRPVRQIIDENENCCKKYSVLSSDALKVKEFAEEFDGVYSDIVSDEEIVLNIPYDTSNEIVNQIFKKMVENNIMLYAFSPIKERTLEEAFMEIIGEGGKQIV